jgi:lysophospholipase
LVSFPAIERAARRLPRAELVRFGPEAAHEILREADPVRDKALRRIDAFLDQMVPALRDGPSPSLSPSSG